MVDVVILDLKSLRAKRASDPARTEEALQVYLARNPNSQFRNRDDINHHPAMATSFKTIVAKYRADNPVSSEFAGVGYGGSGRALGARTAGDPARILEAQRAREQLLMNMAQVMADHKVTALAYKAVEHQPTLIEEATKPPYKSNGGVVPLNTFPHPHTHDHRADGFYDRRHSRRPRVPRAALQRCRADPARLRVRVGHAPPEAAGIDAGIDAGALLLCGGWSWLLLRPSKVARASCPRKTSPRFRLTRAGCSRHSTLRRRARLPAVRQVNSTCLPPAR